MLFAAPVVFAVSAAYPLNPPETTATAASHISRRASGEYSLPLGCGQELVFVLLPAGSFVMGSNDGEDDEQPPRRVEIEQPFLMGKYEVTQEQWQCILGNNPARSRGAAKPVENVDWHDCHRFLQLLEEKFPGGGFRLPTEEEWEYACRNGSTASYSFGNNPGLLPDFAWTAANSAGVTRPVGTRAAGSRGLHDMHGNVWEWCSTTYTVSLASEAGHEQTGDYKVIRGGDRLATAEDCRCANRGAAGPVGGSASIGLRIVMNAEYVIQPTPLSELSTPPVLPNERRNSPL